MRVKVTTEIEGTLKLQYDAIQDATKPTLRNLIEKGMIAFLEGKYPIAALQAKIEFGEREVQALREQLAALRVLEPAQARIQDYEDETAVRQKELQEYLEEDREHTLDGVKRGWLNYKKLAEKFDFTSSGECKRFVRQVVKSWETPQEIKVRT